MYIEKIVIDKIRNIQHLEISFEEKKEGWHVLLGDNGTGKTTILKGIAALITQKMRDEFPLEKYSKGTHLTIKLDKKAEGRSLSYVIGELTVSITGGVPKTSLIDMYLPLENEELKLNESFLSIGFGTNRIFGQNSQDINETKQYDATEAHSTLISFENNLAAAASWLQHLRFQELEENQEAKSLLAAFQSFINQSNLLNGIVLEKITSKGVWFKDKAGQSVTVGELSDGFQSVINLSFNILYQMVRFYGIKQVIDILNENPQAVQLPAVVLVDEIDIHLHPSWQAKIGFQLKKTFPQVQFIVSTHSPLVCHAADTIWNLSKLATEPDKIQVEGTDFKRLKYGDISESFETEVFGKVETQSPEAKEKLARLAYLNVQAVKRELNTTEQKERFDLQQTFLTKAYQ